MTFTPGIKALIIVICCLHCGICAYVVLLSTFFRTTALATKLTEFNLGSDKHTFLSKLIKSIFSSYLESYIDMEKEYLRNRGSMILQRYYDSKNHQKRVIGGGRSGFESQSFTIKMILKKYIKQNNRHKLLFTVSKT